MVSPIGLAGMTQSPANPILAGETAEDLSETGALPRVRVLFPLPLPKPYDYLCDAPLAPGVWVKAPLGGREQIGVVWPEDPAPDDGAPPAAPEKPVDPKKLKRLSGVIDAPALPADVMAFVAWAARYTMFPLGAVLRLVMRSGDGLSAPKGVTGYRRAATPPADIKITPARAQVLAIAGEEPAAAKELAEKASVGEGVVRGLVKAGALETVTIDPDAPFARPDTALAGKPLSPEQAAAAAILRRSVEAATENHPSTEARPTPILLDGVTGAGKTEVYLEAAAAALAADEGAQILIMLPEIALTLPFLERVAARFGAAPAPWHSGLTAAARRRTWRRVLDGSARIVVGARSALFLPFPNLRLVVVDEEHESAYKQEDGVIYHGRDLAVARGALGRFPVILASATPSLETVVNVDQARYDLARLTGRHGGATMPDVSLVDMRREGPEKGQWLSPAVIAAVNQNLSANEQSLLFLNRRGYAPLTICRRCGHRMKAPHSDTWLVEHRFEGRLVCHHTGFSMPKPKACPECNAVDSLSACGPGVERVAEEVTSRWPDARVAVLSSDTVLSPESFRTILDQMAAGLIDILIATQVVAKGHHFPNLTFVGVIDADMGLAGGDLRAAERTFQLLSQVAGRAGRAEKPGRALLQTFQPEAPVLRALCDGDRDAFLAAEAAGREGMGFPPYGRLASIILRSKNEQALKACAEAHRAAIFPAQGLTVWGPAPAPLYRLRGEARIRFLVKARRDVHIQGFLDAWLSRVKTPGPVRRVVDIDPYSFL